MVQARYARLRLESGQIFINHSGTGGGVELPLEGYKPAMDIFAHVLPGMQLEAAHRLRCRERKLFCSSIAINLARSHKQKHLKPLVAPLEPRGGSKIVCE